jgi:hypothetical protein
MATPPPPLPPLEHYRIVRGQIEHEDNLVSQRLSWLLASQSFLFTAYAITLNGPVQLHQQRYEAHVGSLMVLLPLVGIVSAVLIWLSIIAGMRAMRKLRIDLQRKLTGVLPGELPPIQTSGIALLGGQLGPVLIPLLFLTVWLVLLARG